MITTKTKSKKQIINLLEDLEVLNPIETKTILGGDFYNGWDSWYSDGSGITFTYSSGGGSNGGGGYTWGNANDDSSQWGDQGSGYGGGGNPGGGGVLGLPSNVEQQLGGMGACVSYAMAFMSSVLGHQITGANMALHNSLQLNVPLSTTITTGLNLSQSNQAIQSYFNTTALSTVNQVINAVEITQHGVLASVYVYENGSIVQGVLHEVAIVDYDPTYKIFYGADSNTGTYQSYTAEQINLNAGVFEINSVK